MVPALVEAKHRAYVDDLVAVVDTLLATGARVAIASTGLLGESRWALFQPNNALFHSKWPILDAYSAMNRKVAGDRGLSFIDVRGTFLDQIPWTQMAYAWCLTVDGEHENVAGTVVVARLFAEVLRGWLEGGTVATDGSADETAIVDISAVAAVNATAAVSAAANEIEQYNNNTSEQ